MTPLALAGMLLLAGCTSPAPRPIETASDLDEPASAFRSAAEQARGLGAVADRRTPNVTAPLTLMWVRTQSDGPWMSGTSLGPGVITACRAMANPNDIGLAVAFGVELYHAESNTLVSSNDYGPGIIPAHWVLTHRIQHIVNLTDIATDAADSRYVARIWHEVLMPLEIEQGWREKDIVRHAVPTEPPMREDIWINITYSPLRGETFAGSEEECWM